MTTNREKVNVDTFIRAESDHYFSSLVGTSGLGGLTHIRAPAPIDKQNVVRMNRDTLYSHGVFDLDAGPVVITMPDSGERFMSLHVINEDHLTVGVFYDPGPHAVSRSDSGTRYAVAVIRTLVNAEDDDDIEAVRSLQDAIGVEQEAAGSLELPNWDDATLTIVRDTLKRIAPAISENRVRFGSADEVDPIAHLVSTATGWGGNPPRDAHYVGGYPEQNDGRTVHRLTVRDVPVDGFWSISVYNRDGYFEPNDQNAYSINNLTAVPNSDGAVTVQFGGAKGEAPNHLPVPTDWNYVARLYRPRQEVLDGSWTFPMPIPVT